MKYQIMKFLGLHWWQDKTLVDQINAMLDRLSELERISIKNGN